MEFLPFSWGFVAFAAFALWAFLFFWRQADFFTAFYSRFLYPSRDAFAGRVVWIVGASSGIGESLAYELARQGAILILSARRVERLGAVAERCLALGGKGARVLALDVTETGSHVRVAAQAIALFGRIDILINNAGRSQRSLIAETPLAIDQEMMALNFFGVVSVTKAVLPHFLASGRGGHIVNTSSVVGKIGSPCSASYTATKHALNGYMDTLRIEMRGTPGGANVLVTNVCPGPTESEISQHAFTDVPGKALGVVSEGSKMPTDVCTRYMAAAIWGKLPESWIAHQPILTILYLSQYLPVFYRWLAPILGARRVTAFKNEGDTGYNFLNIGGGGKSAGGAKKAAEPAGGAPTQAAGGGGGGGAKTKKGRE